MSQENVEVVRAALAAWNTGDTDTLREAMDPNIVVRPMGNAVVILGHVHLRARGSGIEFDSPIGSVVWVRRDGFGG